MKKNKGIIKSIEDGGEPKEHKGSIGLTVNDFENILSDIGKKVNPKNIPTTFVKLENGLYEFTTPFGKILAGEQFKQDFENELKKQVK